MNFSAIEEIKDLHNDKSRKDEGEMPRVDSCLHEYLMIIVGTINGNLSTTSDSTTF